MTMDMGFSMEFSRSLSGANTTTTTTTLTAKGEIEYYIAAYPYESTEIGDLTFSAGEMIVVTKKDGDWWTGNIGHRSGMFPSNYVQKADVGSNEQQQQSVAGIDDQMDDGKVCNIGNRNCIQSNQIKCNSFHHGVNGK